MKYDLLKIEEKSTRLIAEGGQIISLENNSIVRNGVRRFEGGKLFQTSRLGEAQIDRLITDTREWGGPGVPHEFGFAPEKSETRKGMKVEGDVIAEFKDTFNDLRARYTDFVFDGSARVTTTRKSLTSNYGLELKCEGELAAWSLSFQRKDSGNTHDGWMYGSHVNPQIKASIQDEEEWMRAQRKEAKIKAGRMPVLLVEVGEALSKLNESTMINYYNEGACLFAGKLGQQLFSKQFTLIDDAYDPARGQIDFFDGDGVVRSSDQLKIIDQGRFATLVSNLRWAKKYGQASTGNGVRGYNTGVALSARGLRVGPGKRPWREIVKGLDRCIIATVAAGGDSNDLGEYSSPVQIGYVFEKGELIGRIPQLTVKAQLTDLLGSALIEVSSDGFTRTDNSACVISEMDVMVN